MRKLLILPIAFIVMAGLMSPAEAASKRYSLSVKDRAYEYISKGKYRSQPVIDVSSGHQRDYVKISGRVKRGPVKGKSVRIYATNTNDPRRAKNKYVGKAKLSKSGKYSKKIKPPRGGRWKYTVKIASSGKYKGRSASTSIDAYHWTFAHEFPSSPRVSLQVGEGREYVGPDVRRGRKVYSGTRWGNQFAMNGGSTVTFNLSPYRCKKITFKTGVSDETPDEARSGQIRFSQGSRTLAAPRMTLNQEPFDAGGSGKYATSVRNSLKPNRALTITVPATAATSEEPAPQVRFIVGNPKLFCTFPSVNH